MQFVLNPEIEGLSQFFFIFLYHDIFILIFGFIEVALRSDRLSLVLLEFPGLSIASGEVGLAT